MSNSCFIRWFPFKGGRCLQGRDMFFSDRRFYWSCLISGANYTYWILLSIHLHLKRRYGVGCLPLSLPSYAWATAGLKSNQKEDTKARITRICSFCRFYCRFLQSKDKNSYRNLTEYNVWYLQCARISAKTFAAEVLLLRQEEEGRIKLWLI